MKSWNLEIPLVWFAKKGYNFVNKFSNKPNLDYCILALDVVEYVFELSSYFGKPLASNKVSFKGSN